MSTVYDSGPRITVELDPSGTTMRVALNADSSDPLVFHLDEELAVRLVEAINVGLGEIRVRRTPPGGPPPDPHH